MTPAAVATIRRVKTGGAPVRAGVGTLLVPQPSANEDFLKPTLLSTLTLSVLATFAHAGEATRPGAAPTVAAATSTAAAPISGIDTQFIDTSVRPQDDFFTYLNGKWL